MGTRKNAAKATEDVRPTLSTKANPKIEDPAQNPEAANVASPVNVIKRNMSGTKKVFTDLFKLMVAKVIKYEGWDEANDNIHTNPGRFSHWEHTHPFRTYDKKGEKMTTCTPIGGHFHVIQWEAPKNVDEAPRIISVSGPKVMGKEIIKGRWVQAPVDANDYDDHTHDVEYIRSSEIEFSTTNIEATRVIAMDAAKTAPLPGVQA